MNDEAYIEARERAFDNGIVFEGVLKGHSRTSKRGRKVSFLVHEEDVTKGVEDMEINARYKVVAFEIGDDEQPVPQPRRKHCEYPECDCAVSFPEGYKPSEATECPACVPQPAQEDGESDATNSGNNLPASSTEGSAARVTSYRAYTALGGRRRGDRGYQKFMFDVVAPLVDWKGTPAPIDDQVRRREQVAELQHLYCKVASLKNLKPDTEESLRFELLETAFDADDRGLDPVHVLMSGAGLS